MKGLTDNPFIPITIYNDNNNFEIMTWKKVHLITENAIIQV